MSPYLVFESTLTRSATETALLLEMPFYRSTADELLEDFRRVVKRSLVLWQVLAEMRAAADRELRLEPRREPAAVARRHPRRRACSLASAWRVNWA